MEDKKNLILIASQKLELTKSLTDVATRLDIPLKIFPAHDSMRLFESIDKRKYDCIIVDESIIEKPDVWMKSWKIKVKNTPNENTKLFALISEVSTYSVKEYIDADFTDCLPKPGDTSLIIEKFRNLVPEKSISFFSKELFQSDANLPIDIIETQKIISVSEFGGILDSSKEYLEGSVFKVFAPKILGESLPSALARCTKSELSRFNGRYRCEFVFLGINNTQLGKIRQYIKTFYVEKKAIND